jgi:hypothetical protein
VDVAGERGDLALEQRRAALAGEALAIELLECAGDHWAALLMRVWIYSIIGANALK